MWRGQGGRAKREGEREGEREGGREGGREKYRAVTIFVAMMDRAQRSIVSVSLEKSGCRRTERGCKKIAGEE